jgi:hypothetical protein
MGESMNVERCMCGATDCPRCYPGQPAKATARHYELALEHVVECVIDHGRYPANGRSKFDLYDWLYEHRDASYFLEMYISALSNTRSFEFENRVEHELATVKELLQTHFKDSDFVAELAAEYAEEE